MRSRAAAERIEALIERARTQGADVWRPEWDDDPTLAHLPFVAPALIEGADPRAEIVQAESFGPILVITPAATIDDAIERCNDVPQGLVAAIHSGSASDLQHFTRCARAGIIQVNRSAAGAGAAVPFGGVGLSAIGPPEHGPGDAEFYSRWQAVG